MVKALVLDMAKTLPVGFTMDDLLAQVRKPGSDPKSQLHNHEVTEAAWELVDDGKLKPDGKGGLIVA